MLGKGKKQKDCYHENAKGIYGDAIIHTDSRAYCEECDRFLPLLPPKERSNGNVS